MITDIRLQNFRSYKDETFELSSGVNIVVGANASGKTNLLEAILVLALGSSYRVKDVDLIMFDQPWARLDAHTKNGINRTVKIVAEPAASKSYEIGGQKYKKLSLNHSLSAVLFEPNHLLLLSGGPERRRNYLDDLIKQTLPGYATILRQYKRALAQRNSLLKQAGGSSGGSAGVVQQMFPWNLRLSQLAGQIVRARSDLIFKISEQLEDLYKELSSSPGVDISIKYTGQWSPDVYETSMLKKLEANFELDKLRGFTSTGPHREDFEIYFNGHLAREVASRGETRTVVLALKIIELKTLEESRSVKPLLLLDDVFSELDGRRRHKLTDYLSNYQTFITTTDADLVLQHFTETTHIIPLG